MNSLEIISEFENDIKTIEISKRIRDEKRVKINGLSGDLNVIIPVATSKNDNKNYCFIVSEKKKALLYYSKLCNYLHEDKVFFFPYSFRKPYDEELINNANVVMRTETIQAILKKNKEKKYVVTYPEGLFEKFPDEKTQKELSLILKRGGEINYNTLTNTLNEQGFEFVDFVNNPGEYSIRGNIIDVFSFTNKKPIRIECDGDLVEKIKLFNVETQLTVEEMGEIKILSNIQREKDSAGFLPLFDFMDKNWSMWVEDKTLSDNTIKNKMLEAKEIYKEKVNKSGVLLPLPPEDIFYNTTDFSKKLNEFNCVYFGINEETKNAIEYKSSPQPKFNKNLPLLADDIAKLEIENYNIFISFQSEEQVKRLNTYFESTNKTPSYKPIISKISEGFVDHENKRVVYTDHEIFNRYFKHLNEPVVVKKQKNPIKEKSELSVGDYIVHIDYGIGRFVGLEKIDINGVEHEALRLVYKNNDTVYTSTNSLHKIAKYTGSNLSPTLNNLSTNDWDKKKKKIKSRLVDIAEDLISLYLKRRESKGFAFDKDNYLQIELESSFVYQDTPDQLKTTNEVKKDMERSFPMDRLVCGDVGFGKTEIAIRAAFKAVLSGKQVLILVPTTILAFQHYKTFNKRLKELPVCVDYLSRFRSTKDKKSVLVGVEKGKVDIIIGTHSVLSDKINFKDLGLLIVDEEQKFGVSLKEKIKKRKNNLDCLTMTATPIPRTLHFSLIGVRDISILRTPPKNRQSVHTELIQFSEEGVRDIINNEIMRFGQVFFVHNRVENIYEIASIIQKLVPNAKVAVAHGQQKGDLLEKTVLKFVDGYFDVLVSTNIIESGLDIPNANTIIINQAHMFGLSDLHQMRGRVGRSNKKAFCYLSIPKLTSITAEAKKRLIALEEFSNLGDGLNIALKDLDIRGAGNLLGGEQSGFINDLGFDTYNKILDEALDEIDSNPNLEKTNKVIEKKNNCLVDLFEKALIPKEYITNSNERLRCYNEIEKESVKGGLDTSRKMLEDRFGPLPNEVKNLIKVMEIKKLGSNIFVDKIIIKRESLTLGFFNNDNRTKQETFSNCIKTFNKKQLKYSVKEKKDLILIKVFGDFNLSKTLLFIKKIDN